jgi:hypothetical protein
VTPPGRRSTGGGLRAVGAPRPVRMITAPDGTPHATILDERRRRVLSVRDDWLVQDLWWTDRPVDRHYYELVLEPGRLVVAYREAPGGDWFIHVEERRGRMGGG